MTNPQPRQSGGPRRRGPRRASGRMAAWTAAGATGLLVIGGIAGAASGAFGGDSGAAPAASGASASPGEPTAPVPDAAVPSPAETSDKPAKAKPSSKASASRKPTPRPTKRRPSRPAPVRTTKAPAAPSGGTAAQVIALVNRERAKQGCRALTSSPRLAQAAQAHSADMKRRGFFDHTNPDGKSPGDRVTAAGYRWSAYGENIAKGQPNAASVMDSWMNSSGHRANILNCRFTQIGVGVVMSGGPYWTQVFGTPR